jgi:hypothetical protein
LLALLYLPYRVYADSENFTDGHDSYPLGFDCAHPYTWPAGSLPTYFHASHEEESPSTFYSLDEFQGGSFDPWGGLNYAQCANLLNMEFERVFYKNDFASGAALLSLYMICMLFNSI